MPFIRLRKLVAIAARVLPKLVVDWITTNSVQNINTSCIHKLGVNMLLS